ncbi:V-type H+-transporting ATPase subunit C [Nematocida major]|uniref:V-type H+-transporting ATPase subunit C n=1 Tax=Nematocida major TaxID=1912982 RepID=UPI0020082370|nr:V-type H+-transporting ATPase subunit C [Nematocida major]KAH9385464.1 V-type H+-transporting ATPase subunit C [Nematocida major]
MHIFVSLPVDEPVSEDVLLFNVRKGLGSLGKDCDLLSLPKIESESIDCLFEAEERTITIERLLEDVIRKYHASYFALAGAALTDSVVLGKSFDHFLKSFTWDDAKYPLCCRMSELLGKMESEVSDSIDALKKKEKTYLDEKKRSASVAHPEVERKMHDVDLDEIVHTDNEVLCAPFLKKYYIGVYGKLRDRDVDALSKIDGLFIESGKLVEKCADGEIYVSLGRNDIEEEITQQVEKSGYIVRTPRLTKEQYLLKKEEQGEIAQQLKETECTYERLILGRLPRLYILLLHVKHIGLYIESVLRYGLPSSFCFFILENKSTAKVIQKWKKLAASWKYSDRLSAVEKTAISKDNESLHDFVYKLIGCFNLDKNKE